MKSQLVECPLITDPIIIIIIIIIIIFFFFLSDYIIMYVPIESL